MSSILCILTMLLGAIELLLQAPKGGHIYNICAPSHPARSTFYPLMARQLGLAAPVFGEAKDDIKAKLLMAIAFVKLGLSISIPIRWLMPWNKTRSGDDRAPEGGEHETAAGCSYYSGCSGKKRELCRCVSKALQNPICAELYRSKLESDLNIQILDRSGTPRTFHPYRTDCWKKAVKSSIPFVSSKNRP